MWHRKKRDHTEAEQALHRATTAKKKVEARGKEVSSLAQSLREIRERNHFADSLRVVFGGHDGSPR